MQHFTDAYRKLRDFKGFVQGHVVTRHRSREFSPGSLIPRSALFPSCPVPWQSEQCFPHEIRILPVPHTLEGGHQAGALPG